MKKESSNNICNLCCCSSTIVWGIVFLIVGVYLLAKELDLIQIDIPFWPLVLIILGIYLLFRSKK